MCVRTGESGNTGKVGQVMLETPFSRGQTEGAPGVLGSEGVAAFRGGFVPSSSTI